MFLNKETIARGLDELKRVHPFFGITYLVCKKGQLPIGKMMSFPISKEEENLLKEWYKPDVRSRYYFHPFKTSGRKAGWVNPDYPSSGSQKTRTSGHLSGVFLHKRQTDKWGWRPNYIDVLKEQLVRDRAHHIPAFWLAVWLYRAKEWPKGSNADSVNTQLLREFKINEQEKDALFDAIVPKGVERSPFRPLPCSEAEILDLIPPAPDSEPLRGGALTFLQLEAVGPVKSLTFEPSDRLTIITGDNGLGKTFLLECAWWSLTGIWADRPATPRLDAKKTEPKINFQIGGKRSAGRRKIVIGYDWKERLWPLPKGRPTIPGLIVYARVDGSFAVWDPLRHTLPQSQALRPAAALVFTREEVLNGRQGQIEGLVRDWVKWQHGPDPEVFERFKRIIRRLSPPEAPPLSPSAPIRIPGDPREIPTLAHTYGDVPFTNESAGVRRIVTLAYLLVWAWTEHAVSAALSKRLAEKKIVVLIDEMEAHLHPKWQREILPAILDMSALLDEEVNAQIIIATHSPLVLASVETRFDSERDALYHLDLTEAGKVRFTEVPYLRFGSVDDWLTSDIFELKQACSREGEKAVEDAKQVLAKPKPSKEELLEVTDELKATLPPDDVFWARWAYFLERKGIRL